MMMIDELKQAEQDFMSSFSNENKRLRQNPVWKNRLTQRKDIDAFFDNGIERMM